MSKRRDCEERFRERYSAPVVEAALAVERDVIGANVGVSGYTTVTQADLLAERLSLNSRDMLLDIGSGRGWPALYLAARSGCRAVLTDPAAPALKTAVRSADTDGITSRVSVIRASATHPPFAARTFDAVTHTDTL